MANMPLPGSADTFNISATFGAYSIGLDLSMVLLGVLTLQSYNYFSHFPKEPFWIKFIVAFVWCLEVIQAACTTLTNYIWMIDNYGDPLVLLEKAPRALSIALLFGGFISPVSQSFFAWRLSVLSKKQLIPSICWFLSLLRLAANLLCCVEVMNMKSIPQVLTQWKWLFIFIFSFGWSIDLLVAFCLCYYINRERAHAFRGTARILGKMMEYIIQTNLITSITELAMMTTFIIMPKNFIWLALFLIFPRLFSNSLAASLNSRTHLHEQQKHVHTTFDLMGRKENPSRPNRISVDVMNSDYRIETQDSDGQELKDMSIAVPSETYKPHPFGADVVQV